MDAAPSTPRHALHGTLVGRPMPCSTSRRNSPLLHIPTQRPPAPHPEATAPCSTSRSNSPLLHISEQEHSAPHFGARHRAPDHASERAQRAPIARESPSAKTETARETPARPNGSRHTRHAPDSKQPAASGPAPNGTAAARPPTDRPPVRQATPKRASSRRAVRAASAAGSASDRRRVSQRPPPGQPVTASAASMSVARSDGCTVGAYRSMTWPSRPTRNFAKFHLMALPSSPLFSDRSHL